MAAHVEVENALRRKNLVFTSATAGVSNVSAANNTMDFRTLLELIDEAKTQGHELVLTAGALKIRPANSTL